VRASFDFNHVGAVAERKRDLCKGFGAQFETDPPALREEMLGVRHG
jgi:hypothetical protein